VRRRCTRLGLQPAFVSAINPTASSAAVDGSVISVLVGGGKLMLV